MRIISVRENPEYKDKTIQYFQNSNQQNEHLEDR